MNLIISLMGCTLRRIANTYQSLPKQFLRVLEALSGTKWHGYPLPSESSCIAEVVFVIVAETDCLIFATEKGSDGKKHEVGKDIGTKMVRGN